MKPEKISARNFFLLLIFLSFFPAQLFSQGKIDSRIIKSGIWKGQNVEYIGGEIAIRLKTGIDATSITKLLPQYNSSLSKNFDDLRWGWISIADTSDIMPVISALQNNSDVETIEPNFITHTHSLPNDPYFAGTSPATYAYQWALKNTSQVPPSGLTGADIDATDTWNITNGNSYVIIGILDSGIPMQNGVLSHPDLQNQNRIILGPDYSDDNFGYDKDQYGHGTHVAGIAAAETNNGIGIAGIAGICKLMVIKAFNQSGSGTSQWFYNGVIYAVNYIINNPGYKIVINYSGGGASPSSVMESAISYANSNNVTIVVSAGNSGSSGVQYPAHYSSSYSNVIAVAATDQNDVIASYSSTGPEVNISAPGGWGDYLDQGVYRFNGPNDLGQNIFSTEPNYPFNIQSNTDATQNYGYLAGTSMAAPQVTGTVGLMLSMNASLTPTQIRQFLQNSANKVSGMNGQNFTNQYGYGRLNANQALLMSLANGNMSTNYDATGDNHNRTVTVGNYLYEAFSSGGEIFVRQSSNNGSSWNYTNRVSQGIGNSSSPSIVVYTKTLTTDTVNVVWQRSLGSNYYDIYYAVSCNSGFTWSSPVNIIHNVLVSSDQMGGPQPVIAGISCANQPPVIQPPVGIQPMIAVSYTHGVLVVFTSNSGLKYMTHKFPNGLGSWGSAKSISTSQSGPNIWQPSLSGLGTNGNTDVYLSYDARYFHQIYSNIYDPTADTWSNEVIAYDGSGGYTYDRISCISSFYSLYLAWMSYNYNTGYYTVKFRQGNLSNVWGSWVWTYPGTTGNCYFPSITSYYSGNEKIAITEYTSPGNQVLLHKADVSSQTFQTIINGSNALFPNLPNINYTSPSALPIEIWTGTQNSTIYPLGFSTQNFLKENANQSNHFDIYERAIVSDKVRIEVKNIIAITTQGQNIPISFKNFDYSKQAVMTDPWQYLKSDDSVSLVGIDKVRMNLSISTNSGSSSDSIYSAPKSKTVTVQPTELDIYNGNQLIYMTELSGNDNRLNKDLEFSVPNGTILSLKPVVRFTSKENSNPEIKFTSIENTISDKSLQLNPNNTNNKLLTNFSLSQNYPNPFNPSTVISYSIPNSSVVTLKVYDILGKEIVTLFQGNQVKGTYNILFDASHLSSGVYFYQLKTDNSTLIKKMILMK